METSFLFVNVTHPTWLVYVAFLVTAVFFRFSRVLSLRNLDLTMLLLLSSAIVTIRADRLASHEPAAHKSENHLTQSSAAATATTDQASNAAAPVASLLENQSLPQPQFLTVAVQTDAADAVDQRSDNSEQGTDTSSAAETAAAEWSYRWSSLALIGLTALLLVRLIFDEGFTRRPRLEQNLNLAGLTCLCIPSFAILMAGVFQFIPSGSTLRALEHGRALLERRDVPVDPETGLNHEPAPTETLIAAGGAAVAQLSGTMPGVSPESNDEAGAEKRLAGTLVVMAHTLVVLGLMHLGRRHFGSLQLGVTMSCLYLLLPCTAVNAHELSHVLPAACLVWAISSYRNPVVSGILLGLASGTLFFAAFLLPLWAVFYGRRGSLRFMISVLGVTAVLITCLMMISNDTSSFANKLVTTANWTVYRLLDDTMIATDASVSQLFVRIPMAAVFFVMLTAMTVLPRPRNLENLLANSTSLVVAAQLWYPDDIGMYVLWYLPLFLLVVFRPRLDRFVPPDASGAPAEAYSQPVSVPAASVVALSRLSFFRGH